jgi:phosphatidylinositol alpha-1,6-mannosyltransferase
MRFLVIATDSFGGYGGIAQYNRDLLSAMAADPEVTLLDLVGLTAAEQPSVPEKVSVRCLTRSRPRLVAAVLGAALRGQYDVVLCLHINLMPLAVVAARLLGCRSWLQVHGIDAWSRPSWLRRRSCERASLITAVSRYTRERVLGWCAIDPWRVLVLPNRVGDKFQPGPVDPAIRDEFGITDRRVLLTVSRLSRSDRYKGHRAVIDLLPELRRDFPDLVYLIVGDGGDRRDLGAYADTRGLSDAVLFAGAVRADAMVDLFRAADVFVMPSSKEGFGIVFLEAMMCGTVAIGLNVDGSVDPLSVPPLSHAVAESGVLATLRDVLRAPPPGEERLAAVARIRHRFGREPFRLGVAAVLRRLSETASRRAVTGGGASV